MKYIKSSYKFIITLIIILIIFSIRFPYYIDAPGGISDMQKKLNIKSNSKGTFNIVFVKEYKATIPTLLYALINKDWDIIKQKEVLLENESNKDYDIRDKYFMKESISNATLVAYKKAKKEIKIKNTEHIVIYKDSISDTDIKIGDIILEINDIKIKTKNDISNIIEKHDINDKLKIKVINKDKEYTRYAYIKEIEKEKKLGILLSTINTYKLNPDIRVKMKNNESGSSGGLITALSIYDNLIEKDITKGLKIVGTGTIDIDGNIGSIGGVEYKLKSAVHNKADLFIAPMGENYEDAIKLKNEKKNDIKILGVSTFDEVIDYLENR